MAHDAEGLDALLSAAKAASPGDRIEYRDAIARFGSAAVPAMASWLPDPALGGFAVRVFLRIGGDVSNRDAVLRALGEADPNVLSPGVARDVTETIAALGASPISFAGGGKPEPWPANREVTPLELRFHERMLEVYKLAGEATRKRRPDGTFERGYWATYFLRAVRRHGGLNYAHRLLKREGTTQGFERLRTEGRLDLTMEALVLRPEYAPLFSHEELAVASRRIGGRMPDASGTE